MRLSYLVTFCLAAAAPALPALAQEDFNVEEEAAVCAGCHGEDGVPTEAETPVIWGQQYFYIYTQLRDFGAGRRQNEIMTPMAEPYTRDQAKALAEYFSKKDWPAIQGAALQDNDAEVAQKGITTGQCSACHGKWMGDSRIPRNAGQHAAYLEKTMKDLKSYDRNNAPDMSNIMHDLDDTTIEALARYLSSL